MLIKIGNWAKRFVQEFTGLLDSYPSAAVAYSLRKLKKSYSGSAVRVRRSYDDAEADIGFSNNVLDETALLNHCVPSAVQAKYNDAMYFDGSDDAVVFSNPLIPRTGDFFVSFKFIVDPSFVSPSNVYAITQYTTGTSGRTLLGIDSSGNVTFAIDSDSIVGSNVIDGQEHTYLVTRTTNTYELFLDGVSQGTFFRSGPLESTGTEFGRESSLSRFWQGTIYDININDQHTYNGYGNSLSDWEDQTGTQDGVVLGSSALFTGQGYSGTVARLYDQAFSGSGNFMYFDGIDDKVTLGNSSDFQFQANAPLTISASVVFPGLTNVNTIAAWRTSVSPFLGWQLRTESSTGFLRFFFFDGTNTTGFIGTTNLCDNAQHDIVMSYDGSGNFTVTIDGVSESLTNLTNACGAISYVSNETYIGVYKGASFQQAATGLIYNVNFNNTHSYTGYGTNDTDWEDQIGSIDGTVEGDPLVATFNSGIVLASNMEQSTAANQPFIVKDGAIISEGGLPAISTVGTTLNLTGSITPCPTMHLFAACRINAPSQEVDLLHLYSTDEAGYRPVRFFKGGDNRMLIVYDTLPLQLVNGTAPVAVNTRYLFTTLITEGTQQLSINGTTDISRTDTGLVNNTNNILIIGDDSTGGNEWEGKFQEIIIYNTNQSSIESDIETNINDFYGIY